MIKSLLILLVLSTACSKEESLSKTQLWKMARAEDPSIKLILPKDMQSGINCNDYGEGCKTGFTVQVGVVQAIIIQFDNKKNARREAKRIDQYYKENWVFDDVTGEPSLERFIEKVYKAKRPSKFMKKENIKKVMSN